MEQVKDRFWEKVDKKQGCWYWTACINEYGYGKVGLQGKTMLAHRVSYTWEVGEIPVGLDLDHLCRNRSCVNPAHLEPVTRRENLLRGKTIPAAHARKTHCPNGHEYSTENTYVSKTGARHCRPCRRLVSNKYYHEVIKKKKEAEGHVYRAHERTPRYASKAQDLYKESKDRDREEAGL